MKEVKLVFTAYLRVADEDSIESAIELARANYGNEVADFAEFTIEGESNE